MKRSVDNLKSDQPEMLSKRAEKKRVNLPWNHALFFQVGLIVSLLTVFFIMETSFEVKPRQITKIGTTNVDEYVTLGDFIIEVPEVVKPIKRKVIKKPKVNITKPILTEVEVAPDNSNALETDTAPTDGPVAIDPPKTGKPVDKGPKNMRSVEFVPVFPGCESLATNEARIKCMSSKIGTFVQRKFRTEKFDYLNSDTAHRVYVNFKIDSNGEITDIKAKAINSELEDEGKRVIGKLPKMIPGKQGDVNVDVLYTVPIIFKVD